MIDSIFDHCPTWKEYKYVYAENVQLVCDRLGMTKDYVIRTYLKPQFNREVEKWQNAECSQSQL